MGLGATRAPGRGLSPEVAQEPRPALQDPRLRCPRPARGRVFISAGCTLWQTPLPKATKWRTQRPGFLVPEPLAPWASLPGPLSHRAPRTRVGMGAGGLASRGARRLRTRARGAGGQGCALRGLEGESGARHQAPSAGVQLGLLHVVLPPKWSSSDPISALSPGRTFQ